MEATDWIAVYAAVVATGALLLEVRRWLESGPRLYISMMVDPVVITPGESADERLALSVRVDNRGTGSTTITNLCLHRYPTWFHRLLNRPTDMFVVLHPEPTGYPPNVPKILGPGQQWTGWVRPRPDVVDIHSSGMFVALYANHKRRPTLKRIPKKKELPEGTKQME
jgi:hypothetical protein